MKMEIWCLLNTCLLWCLFLNSPITIDGLDIGVRIRRSNHMTHAIPYEGTVPWNIYLAMLLVSCDEVNPFLLNDPARYSIIGAQTILRLPQHNGFIRKSQRRIEFEKHELTMIYMAKHQCEHVHKLVNQHIFVHTINGLTDLETPCG